MIKVIQTSGFKKLPTSEKEASESSYSPQITVVTGSKDSKKSKRSFSEQLDNKDNNNLMKNTWFVLFLVICGIIFSIWISTELYWLLFEYDIIAGKASLTIIINAMDKKHNLTNLLRSLMVQYFFSYEIIITKNFQENLSELPFLKFKRRNVKIKFLQYDSKDTFAKMRIDSAKTANGDYILFLDPNDYLPPNTLYECYKYAVKENADITQFNHFHDVLPFNEMVHQPLLFDSMFFDKDIIMQFQYHITGKIIKKNVFIDAMKDMDSFYLEDNNFLFEESMLTFKLFRKAKSFVKVKREGVNGYCSKKSCPSYLYKSSVYSEDEVRNILLYLKFLMENTDEKVYEKRMAAHLFIELLVKKYKSKHHYNSDLKILLDQIIALYSKCELINDYEISLMKRYGDYISYKLGRIKKEEFFNGFPNNGIYIFDK